MNRPTKDIKLGLTFFIVAHSRLSAEAQNHAISGVGEFGIEIPSNSELSPYGNQNSLTEPGNHTVVY